MLRRPAARALTGPTGSRGAEDGIIRWTELLEKFRSVQDRARRAQRPGGSALEDGGPGGLTVPELRIMGESLETKAPKEGMIPRAGSGARAAGAGERRDSGARAASGQAQVGTGTPVRPSGRRRVGPGVSGTSSSDEALFSISILPFP